MLFNRYNMLYDNVSIGFRLKTIGGIHGTILIGSLLLKHTGEFMTPYYEDVLKHVKLVLQSYFRLLSSTRCYHKEGCCW